MAAAAAGEMVWARVLEEGVFRFDASEARAPRRIQCYAWFLGNL